MNNRSKTHTWLFGFAILAFLGPFATVLAIESAKKEILLSEEKPSILDLPLAESPTIPAAPSPTAAPTAVTTENPPVPIAPKATAQPKAAAPAVATKTVKKPKSSAKTKTS